ncbi:DNA repair protein RecN [Ascidiimonas sp. W6]|uniref:DNA repair protein RecN n=1 Tax=Ascidiimonas meishanensis TaxID=3128903 RepID=UPI0030EE55E2
MLISLSIKNYALIDHLEIDFSEGLSVITGETGAGKSILLGALSLVLGNRADLNSLRNKEEKCIVEAVFNIHTYGLKSLFSEYDIDFENQTIIRREILPSGKSRAFINDTPCNLTAVQAIGKRLIDIHSQHQTLELTANEFQLKVIDAVADNKSLLENYRAHLKHFREATTKLQKLQNFQIEANKEEDYNTFLLKELQEANLYDGMQEELESIYEKLNNVEEIREKLAFGNQLLGADEVGTLAQLTVLKNTLQKIAVFGYKFEALASRVVSVYIELDDALDELKSLEEDLEVNPELLEETHSKLQLLYDLQKKHQVLEIKELIKFQEELEKKVAISENLETDILQAKKDVKKHEDILNKIAEKLHQHRERAIPVLVDYLENSLEGLGMNNAKFQVSLEKALGFNENGKDILSFLFAANKGTDFGELKKVASGGELSRIMLSIKAILAKHVKLPTIMFDEIDTGVSGEVSNKMGDIMKEMSQNMQVFTITHLPQVAAKGVQHFKVFKTDSKDITTTDIIKLNDKERVLELAEMLGGKSLSESALAHARELLN